MAIKILTNPGNYTAIANAIRAKTGSKEKFKPVEMAAAIDGIVAGGVPTTILGIPMPADIANFSSWFARYNSADHQIDVIMTNWDGIWHNASDTAIEPIGERNGNTRQYRMQLNQLGAFGNGFELYKEAQDSIFGTDAARYVICTSETIYSNQDRSGVWMEKTEQASFELDENGDLLVKNSHMLGGAVFALNDDGELEVMD